MALWQFAFDLIPSSAAGQGAIGSDPGNDGPVESGLGFSPSTARAMLERIGAILHEGHWSTPGLRVWGDERGDDVQAGLSGPNSIDYVQFRLDVSDLALPVVSGVCALARDFDCVFVTDSGAVVQPHVELLVQAALQSDATRYVDDPARYLREHF